MPRSVTRSSNVLRIARFLAVFVAATAVVVSTVAPATLAAASVSAGMTTSLARVAADPAQTNIAKTSLAGFNPGNMMSDAVFTNKGSMSEAKIQAFFDSKVKTCRGGSDKWGPIVCLKDFRITSVDRPADSYCDGYNGAKNESAARIIYRVAQSCGINPQVLIVMLQKEQSLVTHTWPSAWRYDKALGQACPDTAPCDPKFVGFFHQMYGAGRQMQMYLEGKWFDWYAPGKTWNILFHPSRACGTAPVYVANKATAALYYYTPYQPNAAALRAGYGTGDSCSSYGNRNLYNYFTSWFGSTKAPVDKCAAPKDAPRAVRQYVTTTGLNARMAPTTACDDDSFTLAAGTVLQATRVSADGKWIEADTREGRRWVARGYLRLATSTDVSRLCADPAGTSVESGQFVLTDDLLALVSPLDKCMLGGQVGAGRVVQATRISYSGNWLEIETQSGLRWISRDEVADATSADIAAACAIPKGMSPTAERYVVRSRGDVWTSPLKQCGVGSRFVGAGTIVQATRISSSGNWLEIRTGGGLRWIARDRVAVCADPAGTRKGSEQYVVRSRTSALISPLAECGTSVKNWGAGTAPRLISTGTVVQSTRVSHSGKWLEIRTGGGLRWIARDKVAVCADPAGTKKASKQYVVRTRTTALISPLAACGTAGKYWGVGTSPRTLGVGTVVQATRISHSKKWLEVRTSSGLRWVPRADVSER